MSVCLWVVRPPYRLAVEVVVAFAVVVVTRQQTNCSVAVVSQVAVEVGVVFAVLVVTRQ